VNPGADHAAEVAQALEAFERPEQRGIQKVRYSHDAMIDLIIAKPTILQKELADIFGYTEGWVSKVYNSDMFQARLALRKEELVDPTIRLSTEERFRSVTNKSLDILQEKLSKPIDSIPDNLVLKAIELGAKALGVGGNAPPPAVPSDHLAGLASRLLALQGGARRGEILDEVRQFQQIEDVEVLPARFEGGGEGRTREEEAHPAYQGQGGEHAQADGGSVA
jgi:hypothetical protein